MVNAYSGMCLDVADTGDANGALVQQRTCRRQPEAVAPPPAMDLVTPAATATGACGAAGCARLAPTSDEGWRPAGTDGLPASAMLWGDDDWPAKQTPPA